MTINDILDKYHITMAQLSKRFNIPYRTIQNWCDGGDNHRECPAYIIKMIDEILSN